jgi:hypothetical protein
MQLRDFMVLRSIVYPHLISRLQVRRLGLTMSRLFQVRSLF